MCLGVNMTLRLVPPLLVDLVGLTQPRHRDGGCRFRRTWILESLMRATGACLVTLAFADLKLSKSAANCAAFCTSTGLLACSCSRGVLLWIWRDSS
jgi:hypothetical protein